MKVTQGFPLHYQIFVALLLGAGFGWALNPGDVTLPGPVNAVLKPSQEGIVLTETDSGGETLYRKVFADEEDLAGRFPELARLYRQQEPRRPLHLEVTEPRAFIVEDGESVTIRYWRRYAGQTTLITSVEAPTAEQLVQTFPQWRDIYRKHGGGTARRVAVGAKTVGDIFLRLLKMITVPLIVTSLVTGVSGLSTTGRFGALFGKTILYYACSSILAVTTALVMVNVIRPGQGAHLPGGGEVMAGGGESLSNVFFGLVTKLIPPNPIEALAGGDFLAIIGFSILLGICIIYTGGQSAATLRNVFQAAFDVMMAMTQAIIRLAPVGVFAYILFATASQGLAIFQSLAWYMLAVFLSLAVHAVVVLPLLLALVARRSPLQFAQQMSPALMTAFSTASSNATLPLTISSIERRAGVSNRISSFVLPLGATINMDGTALYEAVAVLFIAQATPGIELTFGSQLLVAVTALLASVGAAGIPHAGLVMMAIVLQAVGLPLEAQGVIIAVDRVLDMCRTSVNIWSDSCGCALLARFDTGTA